MPIVNKASPLGKIKPDNKSKHFKIKPGASDTVQASNPVQKNNLLSKKHHNNTKTLPGTDTKVIAQKAKRNCLGQLLLPWASHWKQKKKPSSGCLS